MLTFGYPARFTADEDSRMVVRFPDFPEAVTDGKGFAEAMVEAAGCLGSVIAIRMSARRRSRRHRAPSAASGWSQSRFGLRQN